MKTKLPVKILYLVLAALPAVIACIFLHELGHATVMVFCGTKITEFSILHARVSGEGGTYTLFSECWFNANGVILPLIVSLPCILFFPKHTENIFLRFFLTLFIIACAASLMAWVFLPVLSMFTEIPASDDVTKFLSAIAGIHHPLIVADTALILFLADMILILRKDIFASLTDTMKNG